LEVKIKYNRTTYPELTCPKKGLSNLTTKCVVCYKYRVYYFRHQPSRAIVNVKVTEKHVPSKKVLNKS